MARISSFERSSMVMMSRAMWFLDVSEGFIGRIRGPLFEPQFHERGKPDVQDRRGGHRANRRLRRHPRGNEQWEWIQKGVAGESRGVLRGTQRMRRRVEWAERVC